MIKFPHIDTLFDRDPKTFQVIPTLVRRPEFLSIAEWIPLEKVDGMNVRIQLTKDGEVNYAGRNKPQLPKDVSDMLARRFPSDKMKTLWGEGKPPVEFVIFGEAYGGKIQNGGLYRPDIGFRMFDAAIVETYPGRQEVKVWWQEWDSIMTIAHQLGVFLVPILDRKPLPELVDMVKEGFNSFVASEDSEQARPAEGIVVRSNPLLFNRKGESVIWKLKTRDFRPAPKKRQVDRQEG